MKTAIKTFSRGGCAINRTQPTVADLTANTKILNVEISFEEALKLRLAIDAGLLRLNSYKRSTSEGKRTALNLAIHLDTNQVTVNETLSRKNGR